MLKTINTVKSNTSPRGVALSFDERVNVIIMMRTKQTCRALISIYENTKKNSKKDQHIGK